MLLKLHSLHLGLLNIGFFQLGNGKHLLISLVDSCDLENEDQSRLSFHVDTVYQALSDTWKKITDSENKIFLFNHIKTISDKASQETDILSVIQ